MCIGVLDIADGLEHAQVDVFCSAGQRTNEESKARAPLLMLVLVSPFNLAVRVTASITSNGRRYAGRATLATRQEDDV